MSETVPIVEYRALDRKLFSGRGAARTPRSFRMRSLVDATRRFADS